MSRAKQRGPGAVFALKTVAIKRKAETVYVPAYGSVLFAVSSDTP